MIENTLGHLASPHEVQLLCGYLSDGIELALIEKALQETAENGVKHVKYAAAILKRCLNARILTLEHYLIDLRERKSQTQSGGGVSDGANRTSASSAKEIQRSEAELIQLRRARELGGVIACDEELGF